MGCSSSMTLVFPQGIRSNALSITMIYVRVSMTVYKSDIIISTLTISRLKNKLSISRLELIDNIKIEIN